MNSTFTNLEQNFRKSWRGFEPQSYSGYLELVEPGQRLELLARLLSAELEFVFQPPTATLGEENPSADGDDERVRPCVQLFALRFPELNSQPDLLIRLIVLEYALRLRHDTHPPNPESYAGLCDSQQDRLLKLLELTESKLPVSHGTRQSLELAGPSDSTVKEAQGAQCISIEPLPVNLGCFLLVRLIGRGGMGFVHFAIDLRSTAQVAVKVMRRVDAWSIYRFIEEFHWLSQLSHPNLVKLYDAFTEGDLRYFSMELVEGHTIRHWFANVLPASDARWNRLRRVLGQLAAAIDYLHQHGVLHCDVKSSNMMITSGGRAVLLDLGLAVRAGSENKLVGTLQYMSPEVLSGGCPTSASDWYSFGVMLHEVLTDRYPKMHAEVELDSRSAQPEVSPRPDTEAVRDTLKNVPHDLASLCLAMLALDPADRPTGAEVLSRLGYQEQTPSTFVDWADCSGREPELGRLSSAVDAPPLSVPSLVVIHGESGVGKTSLLERWQAERRAPDEVLISLRCPRQDHTPIRLLNTLVQELVAVSNQTPLPEPWHKSLVAHVREIGALFPQVQQILAHDWRPSTTARPAEHTERTRESSIQALLQWLVELSHIRRMVICIDDSQWADTKSLRALMLLLVHLDRFCGALVVVADGTEARVVDLLDNTASGSPVASTRFRVTTLAMGPLGESTCRRLIGKWAKRSGTDILPSMLAKLVVHSSGNPFLLLELFRAYLFQVSHSEAVDPTWLWGDSHSTVRRRFGLLSNQAEQVLQYLSVAAQPLGFHQLQMLTRILPHDLQPSLSYLASQGWIRSSGPQVESEVEIAHDTFRRVIMQSMPVERLQRRHVRLARIYSSETPPPWPKIAAHYWFAAHYREAATCYFEAARQAMIAADPDSALQYLERANHPDSQRSPKEQRVLTRIKADCLASTGRSAAAAELYDQLLQTESDADIALHLRCLAGEQWIKAGQLVAGLERLKHALTQFGLSGLEPTLASRLLLRRRALRIARRDISRTSRLVQKPFSEMQRCLNRVATPLTFLDNHAGPELILRMAELAETFGSDLDRALAIMRSGVILSFGNKHLRWQGLRRLHYGRQLARNCKSSEAQANGHLCMFVWAVQRGELVKATRHAQQAIEIYEHSLLGSRWEEQFLKWAVLGCYYHRGELNCLVESTKQLRTSAQHRSDPMSRFWTHISAAHWSDLVIDSPEQARRTLNIAAEAIASQSFQSPRFFLWLSKTQQALYEGDSRRALEILRGDWRKLNRSVVLSTNHYRWLALSVRLCCDLLAIRDAGGVQMHYLRDARSCARQLVRMQVPAFSAYGKAADLVIEATIGNIAPLADWQRVVDQLDRSGHCLYARALQWHASLHARLPLQDGWGQAAQQSLEAAGCRAPHVLMNIILPLP